LRRADQRPWKKERIKKQGGTTDVSRVSELKKENLLAFPERGIRAREPDPKEKGGGRKKGEVGEDSGNKKPDFNEQEEQRPSLSTQLRREIFPIRGRPVRNGTPRGGQKKKKRKTSESSEGRTIAKT